MPLMLLAPILLSLAPTAAQATPAPAPATAAPAAPAAGPRRGGRLFISPMGEPFRPKDRDDDSLADWFGQADRNHDNQLTIEEMQQDAERFFALLDVNHDGEIDPDEITRYEEVVAPEIRSRFGTMLAEASGPRFRQSEDNDPHQGAGRFGLLDLPEPVVAADTNFNRGVSLAEFRQAAGQRFLALDIDRKGYLTLAGLQATRPAPPSAPTVPKRPRPTGDESGN
jgi:hypothetical protein